ncbi:hypothetical protein FOFC_14115 [Fusarium oxysporum]|nr:hypothetical protein FOFC_14115 [Fusarium oxysporum]
MALVFGRASEARSTAHYGWICVGFLHAKAKFFYDPLELVRYLEDAVRSLVLFPFNMHDKATWGRAAGRKWASATSNSKVLGESLGGARGQLRRGGEGDRMGNYWLSCKVTGLETPQRLPEWQVPRTTLRDRIEGRGQRKAAHTHRRCPQPIQEAHLTNWVLAQLALGLAPTHNQLREFAQRIVNNQGDLKPIGKNWIEVFLRRNPSVKTLRGKAVDSNRLEEAPTEKVQDCFRRLPLPVVKRIPPQYRYNMDETSIMEGKGNNGLVLGSSDNDLLLLKSLVAGYGPLFLKLLTPLVSRCLLLLSSKECRYNTSGFLMI